MPPPSTQQNDSARVAKGTADRHKVILTDLGVCWESWVIRVPAAGNQTIHHSSPALCGLWWGQAINQPCQSQVNTEESRWLFRLDRPWFMVRVWRAIYQRDQTNSMCMQKSIREIEMSLFFFLKETLNLKKWWNVLNKGPKKSTDWFLMKQHCVVVSIS